MVLSFEDIDLHYRSTIWSEDSARRQRAMISHILTSIHPSLVSDTMLRSVKLCARLCGSITEASELVSLMVHHSTVFLSEVSTLLDSNMLTRALKMVCVEALQLSMLLSQC